MFFYEYFTYFLNILDTYLTYRQFVKFATNYLDIFLTFRNVLAFLAVLYLYLIYHHLYNQYKFFTKVGVYMYKTIIVDDEPWTIIDIEKTFCLDTMGFEIIGSYRTPQKALPAIVSKKPDLVITDIRMPGMTGLELIKSVREQNVNCEFIIVSGHSDFSYAQEAISYGVAGYCLKPLDPKETSDALNRAKRHLDSRKTTTPEPSYLDDNFEGLRNYMITHFSEKLTLKSLAAEFNMNPNYCCSLFTKYLGQTFSAYLTELRITEAQNLLHNSDYSLEEIASMVGFKDYFYFSKVFKKCCNHSPKEYRNLPH